MKNIDKLTWLILCIILISILGIYFLIYSLIASLYDIYTLPTLVKEPKYFILEASEYYPGPEHTYLYDIYTLPALVKEQRYFIMTSTAYSRHPDCIAPKYDDGFTATMTPVREGVVAINVDWIDDKWQIKSPLKLGQKIYIKNIGYFSVEDTGYFTEKNLHFDFWNLDIYKKDYEKAKKWGIEPIEVYVLE